MHVIQASTLHAKTYTVESFYENLSVYRRMSRHQIRSYGCRGYVPWDSRGNGMGMGINVLGIAVAFSDIFLVVFKKLFYACKTKTPNCNDRRLNKDCKSMLCIDLHFHCVLVVCRNEDSCNWSLKDDADISLYAVLVVSEMEMGVGMKSR